METRAANVEDNCHLENKNRSLDLNSNTGQVCNTLYFQGNGASQTQLNKYTGGRKTKATTGELMWSIGRNNLNPLDVIYHPVLGTEDIDDVNLKPFNSPLSLINPVKLVASAITLHQNKVDGVQVSGSSVVKGESVSFHSINFSKYSLGQSSDIKSHYKKYKYWLDMKGSDKKESLILWGVSRGTAATFCALTSPEYKDQYKNIKLVVLEGAVDSIPNVLSHRFGFATPVVKQALNFFHNHEIIKYDHAGASPIATVKNFPPNIPVVFITSKIDTVVPPENSKNLALELAKQGKNEVYVLELEHSTHPYYMYDNKEDHDRYEQFIHAIYERYHLAHKPELAIKGRGLLDKSKLNPDEHNIYHLRSR